MSPVLRASSLFDLRFLVNDTTNSLPSELLKTTREDLSHLDGMSWDELRSILENAGVFAVLRAERLEGLAWVGSVACLADTTSLERDSNGPSYRMLVASSPRI